MQCLRLGRFVIFATSFAVAAASGEVTAQSTQPATAEKAVVRPMTELKIAATIPIAKTADWVAITQSGVWVGSAGPNAVSEIDLATNRTTMVELPGYPCAGLAVDADYLWVPLCGPSPKLAKVDVRKHAVQRVFDVGPPAGEGGIAVGAGSVWLVTDKTGTLSRINPADGSIVKTIQIPAGSYNPVFSDGRVWVTRFEGAEVAVVDPGTSSLVETVPVGQTPRFITAGGGAVWTLTQADGSLSRVDVAEHHDVVTVPLQTPGKGGDITFADGRIWTTMMKTPISITDAARSVLLCQWTGAGGDSLAVGHGAIWLTNLKAGTVSKILLSDLPPDCDVKH